MNSKPTYQQVLDAIGKTQDGGKISVKDHYGKFLQLLINDNTEKYSLAETDGEVDTKELASNLSYAIFEFKKALQAVETFNTD